MFRAREREIQQEVFRNERIREAKRVSKRKG
jgi:hypothetical protein